MSAVEDTERIDTAVEGTDEEVKSTKAPLVLDGESKLQLGVLAGSNFLIQMAIGMIMVVAPVFAQSIGLGAAGVALLVAVPQLPKLLLNLPIGHLVDVVGRKPLLVWGAVLDGIGQLLTAWSKGVAQLLPARAVVGVGTAVGSVTGPATLAYTMDVVGKFPDYSGLLLADWRSVFTKIVGERSKRSSVRGSRFSRAEVSGSQMSVGRRSDCCLGSV